MNSFIRLIVGPLPKHKISIRYSAIDLLFPSPEECEYRSTIHLRNGYILMVRETNDEILKKIEYVELINNSFNLALQKKEKEIPNDQAL